MKKLTLILILAFAAALSLSAQNSVKGTVKDAATGDPLPGVGVIVSTGGGTVTDLDGNYTVSVGRDASITFNMLGFNEVTEKVNGRAKIDVFLSEDIKLLDEVVVLGYTSQKKNELSSSVVSLTSEELLDNSTSDIGTMIQGKAAGVVVMNASGQPGEGAQIRIRGTGSIAASADPLYVVDGIAGGTFNPNDVESITILKDASATALYGASASGGVIVVTTKSAKDRSRTDVTFKASRGVKQALSGRFHPMDSEELYNTQKMMMSAKQFGNLRPESLLERDYDWYNNIFKKGVVQDYYASIAGISGRMNYFASVDHYDEEGSLIFTGFKRNSARLNLSAPIGDQVMFNIRLAYNRAQSDYTSDWKDVAMAYQGMPWDIPFDDNGNPYAVGTPEGEGVSWYGKEQYNPFHTLLYNTSQSWSEESVADLQLVWNINDWLSFTSTGRFASSNWKSKSYYDSRTNTGALGQGSLSQSEGSGWGIGLTELLKAHKNVGPHALNGIVGYEVSWGYDENMGATGGFMPTGMKALNSTASGFGVWGSDANSAAWAFLAQAQYSYQEKYIATASLRYDKTYKFAPKARGGFFPGVSAAWIISKEDYMQDYPQFNLLKLRVGYGKTGNSDIEPFLYQDSFSTSYTYNNKVVAVAERMANPNLGWEVAYMASLGLEAMMYDRINFSMDLYNTNNKDLLLDVPQAASSGFTYYTANIGTINNKGVELAIDADLIKTKNLRWNAGFNFGRNRNTVVYLPNGSFRRGYGTPKVEQIVAEGHDIYTWYMPEWAGVDPENGDPLWWWDEIASNDAGKLLYYVVDANGEPTTDTTTVATDYPVYTGNRVKTNSYDKADYKMTGSATPKFTGGFSSSLSWKNLTLSANFHFVYGNLVFNRSRITMDGDGSYIDYNMMSIDNGLGWVRWTDPNSITDPVEKERIIEQNQHATHPRPMQNGNKKSNSYSTRYLEDGSFLRFKNITLSYNLSKPLFNGFIQGGRVYFTADNIYTWTKFSGADPEVRLEGSGSSLAGTFSDNYPVPRSFIFGIDLKF